LLIEAARNSDQKYREAALKFAGPYLTPENITLWTNELAKADTTEKAAIITMLGNSHARSALRAVIKELKNENQKVVLAAIKASGQIGDDKILNNLFQVLKSGDDEDDLAVQNALMVMKGHDLPQRMEKQLAYMPPGGQVALINVLAARRAHEQIGVVLPLLSSNNTAVHDAAYSSLKHLAEEDNMERLLDLLASSTQNKDAMEVQAAIIAVIGQMKDRSTQTVPVLAQMDKADAEKKPLYFNILAAIGDKKSLNAVSKAFEQGNIDAKHTAITALSQWVDISAAPQLFTIAKTNADAGLKDQALRGYIETISKSNYPAEEKVIYLRDAMEVAQTVQQKKLILQQTTNNKTFPALLFVGSYLYDPQLHEEAANSVAGIALTSKDFYGSEVKRLLERTMQLRKGGDSDYEREAIRKFIAEMPADAGFVALFNNKDLAGWKGLVGNPIERAKMDAATLEKEQQKADETMKKGWYVKDSILNFTGEGENICTIKQYRNFEMYVDWKILAKGDAGIYLRGSPQVQIWDTSRVDVGAQVGSGSLYNNKAHESKPLKLADNAIGDWNNFHIIMKGDKVTVYLNGVLVVDNVVMDNYWDRNQPIFPKEQIELQAHGNHVYYRDIYLRELPE
jgi:HEAT repeat protein